MGNYLIITTNKLAGSDPIKKLKKLKEDEGYSVEVASVNKIYDECKDITGTDLIEFYTKTLLYFYTTQYKINPAKDADLMEKYIQDFFKYQYRGDYLLKALRIRSYIEKRYQKDSAFYVLLAGNIGHAEYGRYENGTVVDKDTLNEKGEKLDFVPAFYDLFICGYPVWGNENSRNLGHAVKEMQILTDFYYANLTMGTNTPSPCWDAIVARIPTSEISEMEQIVDKLARYNENKDTYVKKGLSAGSDQKIFDNGTCKLTDLYWNAVNDIVKNDLQKFIAPHTSYGKDEPDTIVEKLNQAEPPFYMMAYRGDAFENNAWAVSLESNLAEGGDGGFSQDSILKLKKDLPFAAGITVGGCWLDRYNPPFLCDKPLEDEVTKCLANIYKDNYPEGELAPIGKFWTTPSESNQENIALSFIGATRVPVTKFNQMFHSFLYSDFANEAPKTVGELVKNAINDTYELIRELKDTTLLVSYADNVKMYMLLGDPSLAVPTKVGEELVIK